jgi:tripartite-type tricarboxylate transporter receptor subunit TctC
VILVTPNARKLRAGKLRVLAVVSPRRLPGTPELPTAVEQGFPSVVALQSIGLIAPADTPSAVIAQLAQAIRMTLADPDSNPETFRRCRVAAHGGARLARGTICYGGTRPAC